MVRPSMSYAAATWHTPGDRPSGVAKKLGPIQNKYLRLVAGAYRATSASAIEVEVDVPPLDLFLDERLRAYASRMQDTKAEAHRREVCSNIRLRTRHTETGPTTATQR